MPSCGIYREKQVNALSKNASVYERNSVTYYRLFNGINYYFFMQIVYFF
jgi:hypothetical protein